MQNNHFTRFGIVSFCNKICKSTEGTSPAIKNNNLFIAKIPLMFNELEAKNCTKLYGLANLLLSKIILKKGVIISKSISVVTKLAKITKIKMSSILNLNFFMFLFYHMIDEQESHYSFLSMV